MRNLQANSRAIRIDRPRVLFTYGAYFAHSYCTCVCACLFVFMCMCFCVYAVLWKIKTQNSATPPRPPPPLRSPSFFRNYSYVILFYCTPCTVHFLANLLRQPAGGRNPPKVFVESEPNFPLTGSTKVTLVETARRAEGGDCSRSRCKARA